MNLSDYTPGSIENEKKVAAGAIMKALDFLNNKMRMTSDVQVLRIYQNAIAFVTSPDTMRAVTEKINQGFGAPRAVYEVYTFNSWLPNPDHKSALAKLVINYILNGRSDCGSYFNYARNAKPMVGIINGMQMNAVNNYFEEKFQGARGHGFAAERANTQFDILHGRDARIVGDDNAKDGADRIVNGVNIQSKYCSSGSKCIQECFRDGKFRYYNADGSPMQIEVPSDKYDDAVRAMQDRIDKGQIKGVRNANDIVRKGQYTYEQAKNITKFGNIDSLKYDAGNGAIVGLYSGGISAAITFAASRWQGKSFDEALDNAINSGLQVFGTSFAVAVVAGQASKAGLNSALVGSTDMIVSMMGPKASAALVNAFRSGTNIYGAAAMKSASKLLRGNAITGVATVLIMSAGDVVNIFRGRISGAQLFKNVVNTTSEVAGGVGGWAAGASAGAVFGPVGALAGGLFGAFMGSSAAGKVSRAVTDEFIEDDAKKMVQIIEGEFQNVVFDYLLNERETTRTVERLQSQLSDGSELKDMYASSDRAGYARRLLVNCVEPIVRQRPKVELPTSEQMVRGLREVLERN